MNYSPSALIRPGTQRPREKGSDKGVERVTKERCDLKAGGTEKEEKKRYQPVMQQEAMGRRKAHVSGL